RSLDRPLHARGSCGMNLYLRKVVHPQAHDNYRVILKREGDEFEIGSIGIEHGAAWRWGIDTVIPMRAHEAQGGGQAGEMLIEAKEQVGYGGWGRWLAKNFDLNPKTASVYMRWARHEQEQIGRGTPEVRPYTSLSEMRGDTERRRDFSQS